MEIFGFLAALPVTLVVSLFLSGLIHKFLSKNAFARWGAALITGVFLIALVIELALISKFGIVEAHDKFYPLLDRMQGYNLVFGPIALTCFAVLWMRKMPLKVVKWCAGFVCFCSFAVAAFSNLFYDAGAHYRVVAQGELKRWMQ